MKKKFLVLVCALVLVFGLSLTAAAEASPSGSQITETGGRDLRGGCGSSADRNSCDRQKTSGSSQISGRRQVVQKKSRMGSGCCSSGSLT